MLRKLINLVSNNSVIQIGNRVKGNMCSGNIIVDGKVVQTMESGINYEIKIDGNVKNLSTQGRVNVTGTVGKIDTQGKVVVAGSITGNVDTMGSVEVGGSVGGKIDTMGPVRIHKQL